MTPPPTPDDLPTIGAAVAALKPVHWLLLGAVTATLAASQGIAFVRDLDRRVELLTLIVCADATAAADTYCKEARR